MDTVRGKEVHENRVLIEKLVGKLLSSGSITDSDIPETTLLFRKTLVRHPNKTPRERVEILVSEFHKYKDEHKSVSNTVQKNTPIITEQVVSVVKEHKPSEVDQKIVVDPQEQMLITKIIGNLLENDKDIPLVLKTKADDFLTFESKYILGTGVSEPVVQRLIENLLKDFKQKKGLVKKHAPVSEPVLPVAKQAVEKIVESKEPSDELQASPVDARLYPQKAEEKEIRKQPQVQPIVQASQIQSQILHKTSTELLSDQTERPVDITPQLAQQMPKQQISTSTKTEIAEQIASLSQPEVKVGASEQTQQTQQTSQSSLKEEKVFGTKVMSPVAQAPLRNMPGIKSNVQGVPLSTVQRSKKSLAEKMMQAARQADESNPLVSSQHPTEMPKRPLGRKNLSQIQKKAFEADIRNVKIKEEVVQPIPQDTSKKNEQQKQIAHQVAQSIKEKKGSLENNMSSASNTKMMFDRSFNLDGTRIQKKHEIHGQQKDLFGKYVSERVDAVIKVVREHGVTDEEKIQNTKDSLTTQAQKIVDDQSVSISERISILDKMFSEKQLQFAAAGRVDITSSIKQLVDPIMERAKQEIRTKDEQGDVKFMDTLHNTLHFKVRHLFGTDMEKDKIKAELEEEYIKHKTFYLKGAK
ncbi:MAG: hypothetical protein KAR24_00520 [Candidatus Pacebacteria bacterium]|nr:hypothetical protein [Candidatus Paceibacterota bacterium]